MFWVSGCSGERCRRDSEQWFFFVKQQEREARGGRPNRTTSSGSGYWKATGSPSYVYSSDNRVIGVKKTMVFYRGKAPTGTKTKWKMNEYKAIEDDYSNSSSIPTPEVTELRIKFFFNYNYYYSKINMNWQLRHEFSLCRVYVVSGSFRAFDRRPLKCRNWSDVYDMSAGDGTLFKRMPFKFIIIFNNNTIFFKNWNIWIIV